MAAIASIALTDPVEGSTTDYTFVPYTQNGPLVKWLETAGNWASGVAGAGGLAQFSLGWREQKGLDTPLKISPKFVLPLLRADGATLDTALFSGEFVIPGAFTLAQRKVLYGIATALLASSIVEAAVEDLDMPY